MPNSRLTPSARVLRWMPSVGPLDPSVTAAIDRDARTVDAPAGRVLFDSGSPCHGWLVIERGKLRVVRVAEDGRELLLYHVGPGESCVLTLSCLLGGGEYPARGITEVATSGLLLPAELFDRVLVASPAFRAGVFRTFTERLHGLVDLAAAVRFEALDRRLARRLLDEVAGTGRIVLSLTHAGLAADLGSARERVSRLLEGFAAEGVVELGRGRITVRDKARLQDLAGDPESRVV